MSSALKEYLEGEKQFKKRQKRDKDDLEHGRAVLTSVSYPHCSLSLALFAHLKETLKKMFGSQSPPSREHPQPPRALFCSLDNSGNQAAPVQATAQLNTSYRITFFNHL